MNSVPPVSLAARTSAARPRNSSKRFGRGSARKHGKSGSAKRDAGVSSESMTAVRVPPVCTSIVTGPVSGLPSPGAGASGKAKRRHEQRPVTQSREVQAEPSSSLGASADAVATGPPGDLERTEIWFAAGSASKTGPSRRTVTTSPGLANGVVTAPKVEGNLRSLEGTRLHDADAGLGVTMSISAARVTQATTWAGVFIDIPQRVEARFVACNVGPVFSASHFSPLGAQSAEPTGTPAGFAAAGGPS